ncbi:beta-ketoacyl-[acyl-carrier-protein] synthase family protein [Nitrogeniibacter mangrovi]|uniref:Nodulation protein E n=1 Tax=Nitrogeniibacter mangrovi TaxID=2016596 RepID=A0A6C1AZB8_9RHOO|nr:beta-ketoacyl-[acyl-carrier-protein] synthase family protein [Nitrogeniibacter mangrovi]QID16473.1 beta-ketoacyl-[acyl-carrier-protein] synthase family protein [Nitrogeniibacter mangrovi]
MSRPRRVAITGIGVGGPWGSDADALFTRLLAGESAVALHERDEDHLAISIPAVHWSGFDPLAELGTHISTLDRSGQLGLVAARRAWAQSGLARTEGPDPRGAVYWGTALAGTLTFERGYREMYVNGRRRVPPLSLLLGMNNTAASHIAIEFGMAGACLTYTIACAAAATAIGEGFRRVREGRSDVVIAGGSDSPMSLGVVRAWEALRVLAPAEPHGAAAACRPFASDRAGLVLGEGGAALILEDWDHARARGATILAELTGYGCSSDAEHLVRPSARGQVEAMRQALADGGMTPADVDYVNAHGTATPEGDPIEIDAIGQVFGAAANTLPVSATKSMHGHMMGATGALEAIICVQALRQGRIPPTAHLETVDPACEGVLHVRGGALERPLRACLSNAFAFGGSNAVLAFRRAED